uniref:Protein kinase domain-containing protein n=1 Tax=Leersia perrieri TaxID=77586 RepID=A0A0D9XI59_9ORYZ
MRSACKDRQGGYDCPCKTGMKWDGKAGTCTEKYPLVVIMIVGAVAGLLVLATLVYVYLLHKERQKMREFFIGNGGPIEHRQVNRLLPRGRCPNLGVRVCLEWEPKRRPTRRKKKVPLTLDNRLLIASGSAVGLAYMHSMTLTSIQHGDRTLEYILSNTANILLDNQFNPKIFDFGISRLIARGNPEHTINVIGDNKYMDPIYRQTGLLTNKSDVYVFGLVLFEIITGKEIVDVDVKNTLTVDTYLTKITTNKMLFDKEIGEKDIDHLRSIVDISKKCLDNDVNERPEMTDIAECLQYIRKARKVS